MHYVLTGVLLVLSLACFEVHAEEFDEFVPIVEINATDGDIGFHFLMDGDDLNSARIHDPNGQKVFEDYAKGPMKEQKLTETFAESAEPVCKEGLKEDEDDLVVTKAYADAGPTLKRIRPAPMGRAFRIVHRTSHLTIEVSEKVES